MIRNEKRFKIVVGTIMTLLSAMAIGFLAYAFYQKSRAEELEKNSHQLQVELQNCQKGTQVIIGATSWPKSVVNH